MEAIRTTPDKNGASSIVVSGATSRVGANTPLRIRVGDRTYNGGILGGTGEYRRAIPTESEGTVELWTADKVDPELIDSCVVTDEAGEEEPVIEEAVEAPKKAKK
jgi:hypothetical protein